MKGEKKLKIRSKTIDKIKVERMLTVDWCLQPLKESVYPVGCLSGFFRIANSFRNLPGRKFIKHLLAWDKRIVQDHLARTCPARRHIFELIMKLYPAPTRMPDRETDDRDMPFQRCLAESRENTSSSALHFCCE